MKNLEPYPAYGSLVIRIINFPARGNKVSVTRWKIFVGSETFIFNSMVEAKIYAENNYDIKRWEKTNDKRGRLSLYAIPNITQKFLASDEDLTIYHTDDKSFCVSFISKERVWETVKTDFLTGREAKIYSEQLYHILTWTRKGGMWIAIPVKSPLPKYRSIDDEGTYE
jgi:hypothetical protein